MELSEVIWCLENDTEAALNWFDSNYMQLNIEKCKVLLMGHKTQLHTLNVNGTRI